MTGRAVIAIELLEPQRLWLLLGVVTLAVLHVVLHRRRGRHIVRFTSLDLLDSVAPSRPQWRRHVVAGVQLLGLTLGVVAVARPVERETVQVTAAGRIMIVFDVSLSMMATDVDPDRLTAAKDAALEFVARVDERVEVGLISFSGQVRLEVPPSLDRDRLVDEIEGLELGEGTAIGDALEEAVDELLQGDDDTEAVGSIVLLSDGETTVGQPTADGAALAADAGVPVYAIALGTPDGTVIDPGTGEVVPVPVNLDELAAVAETTDGAFFEAPTSGALRDAYDQISDDLREILGDPEERIVEQTWAWAMAGFALLTLGWALGLVWLRGLL